MLKYFKDIYKGIVTPLQGMKITSRYIFTPRVTRKYPEAYQPMLPEAERNKLEVNMVKCTGCQMCAKSCPSKCIKIETVKAVPNDTNVPTDENGKPKKLLVIKFDIDFALCCFCALCEENCPSAAIYRTSIFDYSAYYRKDLVHSFSKFSTEEVAEKKSLLAKFNLDKKTAEAKAVETPAQQ
jgi:NADH-quinone oxidoreductase subunit I